MEQGETIWQMDTDGVTSMRCRLRGKFIEVEIDLESFEPDPFPGRFPILFFGGWA